MNKGEENFIGCFRYEGKLVEDGLIEARAASRALNGIDTALHYFLAQEEPALGTIDLPLPVQIRKGSWETWIPHTIQQWVVTAAGLGVSSYIAAAAKKLAENDLKDVNFKKIIEKSMLAIQQLIKIGKHLGHLEIRSLNGLKWDKDGLVGIPNDNGEVLYLPTSDLKRLAQCPPSVLADMASVIEEERKLVVRVNLESGVLEEAVTRRERHIFFTDEEDTDDVLFPELTHGLPVSLDGVVTRGNEMSNTIGFWHKEHVLTGFPTSGNIVRFKKHLFLKCRIHGEITRLDKHGSPTEKRPKIRFQSLVTLSDEEQFGLKLEDQDEDA